MIQRLYKLTDSWWHTEGHTVWGPGISNSASGNGSLCTNAWIHAYESRFVASFMHPAHVSFDGLVLWEAEGEIGIRDGDLKVGCRNLETIRIIDLPAISMINRLEITGEILRNRPAHAPKYSQTICSWLRYKKYLPENYNPLPSTSLLSPDIRLLNDASTAYVNYCSNASWLYAHSLLRAHDWCAMAVASNKYSRFTDVTGIIHDVLNKYRGPKSH